MHDNGAAVKLPSSLMLFTPKYPFLMHPLSGSKSVLTFFSFIVRPSIIVGNVINKCFNRYQLNRQHFPNHISYFSYRNDLLNPVELHMISVLGLQKEA